MPRKSRTPESYTAEAVRNLLDVEQIFYIRVNSGTILLENKDGSKRAVRMAKAGTSDYLAFIPFGDGSFLPLWCETKAGKNGLSHDQKEFRDDVTSQGHAYLMIRDASELVDWLRAFRASLK